MAIVRWDPFREMMSLQREMNRLFDDISTRENNQSSMSGRSMSMMPLAEMEESDGKIHLKLEVPGMNADDIDIRVTKEAVMINGERKTESTSEQNGQRRSEFRYGSFSRTIPLPEPVDNSNVQAEYRDGILTLDLPKVEDNSNKAVKVSLSGGSSNTQQIAAGESSFTSMSESHKEEQTA
ncbi:Hsp20/alpha crystallin family protein [cf. Phormidesmis sp. LEGE 11477]|uniref:Hsp20/alpha crystallin family protein n=1 Tax=cf. Phormidesmis sp. LEGE 11477 TaxID=1828680 RepID=UPI0018817264|nr:Hsp20/alpha crystallin family protein [cf. Phormidesmis sp. LEGE 11477]MBE9063646.1 Hsp20/alpha crystallin family protein [cf. Phormidesmis sp. LEGE 11477]